MNSEESPVLLTINHKPENLTSSCYATRLPNGYFRLLENDLINEDLTYGTEIETRIDASGKHELIRIVTHSPFDTNTLLLPPAYAGDNFRPIGKEIEKIGGTWEVVMGGLAIINTPKNVDLLALLDQAGFNKPDSNSNAV